LSREYVLNPKIGHTVEEAIENTNPSNAKIDVYEYGTWQYSLPALPITMRLLEPEISPAYQRQEHLVMREGEKVMKKPIPEDKLTSDVNPFYQIIYKIVEPRETTTLEEIQRALIHDYQVFEETNEDLHIIERIVEQMNRDGIILKHLGAYKIGITLGLGDRVVDFIHGYDPFENELMRMIKGRGLVSNRELHEFVLVSLGWTKRGELVENYLRRLVEKGCIEPVGDYYRFKKDLKRTVGPQIEKI